jgi:hypothetical protein
MYTVYDRIFGDFPAKNTVYIHRIYVVLANPTHTLYFCRHHIGLGKFGVTENYPKGGHSAAQNKWVGSLACSSQKDQKCPSPMHTGD